MDKENPVIPILVDHQVRIICFLLIFRLILSFKGESSRADSVDKWERGKTVVTERPERAEKPKGRYERGGRDFNREDSLLFLRICFTLYLIFMYFVGNERPQRKPITIEPRTSNDPIGAPASPARKSSSSPFGDAKPRDEMEMQRKFAERQKQKEEEAKQQQQKKQQQRKEEDFKKNERGSQQRNKSGFRKGNANAASGRDFSTARENMGKTPVATKPASSASRNSNSQQKKFKPQSAVSFNSTFIYSL